MSLLCGVTAVSGMSLLCGVTAVSGMSLLCGVTAVSQWNVPVVWGDCCQSVECPCCVG